MSTTYTPSPSRRAYWPRRRGRILLAVAGLMVVLLAVGCDSSQQVPWATYNSGLQQRIDSAAATGNCAALAGYLASAKETSTLHEKATGFPNDALQAYIEAAQAQAGCHTAGS
jgi:hypothetical protein